MSPGARHDAERVDRERQRPGRAAATTATASSSTAPARRCSTARSRGNGDGVGFEHGIYAGATARRYTIAGNPIGGNAGADIKAAGGPGLVADNRLTLVALRPRALRQPGARDVRSTTSSRAASSTGSCSRRARRPRVRGSGTTPCSRPGARRAAATPRRCSSSAPRSSSCATTSSRTRTPTLLGVGVHAQRRDASWARSRRARTGTRAPTPVSAAWPGTARA